MNKYTLLLLVIMIIMSNHSYGQTTRNEIHNQIKSKDYSLAERTLKQYLQFNEKDGIAHLWLANILYRKARTNSDNSAKMIDAADSALIEYSRASSYLTASDVKNNQSFFDEYSRRDLRTGNYIIRYEDITYEIENNKGQLANILLRACRENRSEVSTIKIEDNSAGEANSKNTLIKSNGKYYALIIGVSEYTNYKLNLFRPVIDAEKLKNVLVANYTFEDANTTLILNPTRQDILSELYTLRKKLNKNDNLLIFYAGHGMYDEEAGQGYWWPKNADSENPSNWLSNSDLRDQIRGIKSSHTLLITDACFSGGIFRTREAPNIKNASLDILSLYKIPSRRAITSGTMTTVPDNSIFFDYLLKALENNNNTYLSSQSLFESFRAIVINNTLQVPQDGVISETGDEGGDFIFIKRE